MVIELDGEVHLKKEVKANDALREKELKRLGCMIIRFSNQRVLTETAVVIEEIYALCRNRTDTIIIK